MAQGKTAVDANDILVADGTLSGALRACRALMKGSTVAQAGALAGVTERTVRSWRAQPWWGQVRMLVESEVRDELLGASLEVLRERVVKDRDDKTAMFLVKLFVVDTAGKGAGRPSRAEMAGVKGDGPGVPSGLTPEQAVALLEQAEEG
jgi:hypothetical protein